MSNKTNNRPLSPHLQIYKLIPTMLVSIVHRITGAFLYFGTTFFVLYFLSLAGGIDTFNTFKYYADNNLFEICLFLYTWSVIHHMLGGLRYLIWDAGLCFDKHLATKFAKINIFSSVLLVLIIWIIKNVYQDYMRILAL
ncbi:succinate dehydrogenase, cytochrome b556 subunit [Candidatus Liberibacter americanus]|uniref:Succinate dehydrogenase cytochrome b556 subunit n=1 Tax=Candidatus Liberibacter americanus str. Sao Paulo TaxID=1261131 RepID=U6B8P8_9HYPH|nr:succinate dehydrogenase, cytochrome b556 subunit [Candidatus Liberibacter americanus]AHA28122.1 Succinate dehydrogenase/fumarate reductase cytochrome b subunit [Candidatus Liberibacter americanus str. Sao Paulo]EMS36031.1 succinate dehydrogenase protein, cytochrome b subunit [Candidatus Liberibacter americanus PW_SP]